MREKLIELLEADDCPLLYVLGENVGSLADYLIANGVTIVTDNNVGHKLTPTGKDICVLTNGVTVQQWIPVSERLPELDVDVLAFNGDYIFISQYYISHFCSWDKVGHLVCVKDSYAKNPTHWMPLPQPPKGE